MAFFLIPQTIRSQLSIIDSLKILLKTDKQDTNKVNHLNTIASALMYNDPDTSIILNKQALLIAEELEWQKGMAVSLGNLGVCHYLISDYSAALEYNLKALVLDEKRGDKTGMMRRLGNIGTVYANQADYPKALDYYLKALKIAEDLKDNDRIATALGNIGNIYWNQSDHPKALNYYQRALEMNEKLGNKNGIARQLGNIGIFYAQQGDYLKALDYYFKALKITEELEDKNAMSIHFGNIGVAYNLQASSSLTPISRKKEFQDKALEFYFKSLKMAEEIDDKNRMAVQFASIGSLYVKIGKFKEAEEYLKKAVAIEDSIGSLDYLMQYEESLSRLYDTTGRHQLAFMHYKKAMALKDTLFSQENKKQLVRKEMNYEFEKKETATKAEQDKKDAIVQIIIYSVSGGFILVLLLALFIFRGYNQKKKANLIISQQKHLVEEKQKDILDSIHYAKRIQSSLMMNENHIKKTFDRLTSKKT